MLRRDTRIHYIRMGYRGLLSDIVDAQLTLLRAEEEVYDGFAPICAIS